MTTPTVLGLPACTCQVRWFRAFFAELVALGLIKKPADLGLVQLIGDAEASAGVHAKGGCGDWRNTRLEIAQIAREMGAPATWPRVGGTWAGNEHTHSGLRGCPHMAPGGRAQIVEVDAGGDGLLGSVPDDPRLKPFLNKRTWQEGIAWHQQQARLREIARLEGLIAVEVATRDKASARIKRLRSKRDQLKELTK